MRDKGVAEGPSRRGRDVLALISDRVAWEMSGRRKIGYSLEKRMAMQGMETCREFVLVLSRLW